MKLINVKNPVLKNGVHYLTGDYKTRANDKHNGMDMIGKNYAVDDIIAIEDGKVYATGYNNLSGYYVELIHDNKLITRYLHMKKGTIAVKKGDIVVKGQTLGRMGSTGDSTGAHLHFAVCDESRNFKDPLPYLLGNLNFNSNYFHEFVVNVQTLLGAKIDGIAGKDTLSKTITVGERINRKHPIVKYLQEYLTRLGYTEIGNIDGIAGPKFTKAIKHFQKDNDFYADGIITAKNRTWKRLLKLI